MVRKRMELMEAAESSFFITFCVYFIFLKKKMLFGSTQFFAPPTARYRNNTGAPPPSFTTYSNHVANVPLHIPMLYPFSPPPSHFQQQQQGGQPQQILITQVPATAVRNIGRKEKKPSALHGIRMCMCLYFWGCICLLVIRNHLHCISMALVSSLSVFLVGIFFFY